MISTGKIDRNKFESELGRQCYDKIMELNPPHEDFVLLMLALSCGDDRRKILIDFLDNKCKNCRDLHDFVIEKWGQEGIEL